MADILDNLTLEKKVKIREFKKNNFVLEDIICLFKTYLEKESFSLANFFGNSHKNDAYLNIYKKIKDYEFNSEHLTPFIELVSLYQDNDGFSNALGLFLSALINACKEDNLEIITSGLDVPINMLGYKNKKSFEVFGDVGLGFGESMDSGEVVVNGNAGSHLAYRMSGGSIILKGNAKNYLGCLMESSKLIIEGNAGVGLCERMKNSEVHLNGNFGRINYHYSNTYIYYKYQLLFLNGSPINRFDFDYYCPINDDYYLIDEHPYWKPKKELFLR